MRVWVLFLAVAAMTEASFFGIFGSNKKKSTDNGALIDLPNLIPIPLLKLVDYATARKRQFFNLDQLDVISKDTNRGGEGNRPIYIVKTVENVVQPTQYKVIKTENSKDQEDNRQLLTVKTTEEKISHSQNDVAKLHLSESQSGNSNLYVFSQDFGNSQSHLSIEENSHASAHTSNLNTSPYYLPPKYNTLSSDTNKVDDETNSGDAASEEQGGSSGDGEIAKEEDTASANESDENGGSITEGESSNEVSPANQYEIPKNTHAVPFVEYKAPHLGESFSGNLNKPKLPYNKNQASTAGVSDNLHYLLPEKSYENFKTVNSELNSYGQSNEESLQGSLDDNSQVFTNTAIDLPAETSGGKFATNDNGSEEDIGHLDGPIPSNEYGPPGSEQTQNLQDHYYNVRYLQDDGAKVAEEGKVVDGVLIKSGEYEYVDKQGIPIKVKWIADDYGFRIIER